MRIDLAIAPILWNPAALSYLTELTLDVFICISLIRPLFSQRWRGPATRPNVLLAVTMAGVGGSIFCSLMRAQAGGPYASYAMPWTGPNTLATLLMPWSSVGGAISIFAFVQFLYCAPSKLLGSRIERRLVGAVLLAFLGIEVAIALTADAAALQGRLWFRSGLMILWMVIALGWAGLLCIRQFVAAAVPGEDFRLSAIRLLFARRLPAAAHAARAYLMLLLLPLLHLVGLALLDLGLLGRVALDTLSCWWVLALLTSFSLIYFNYQAEKSSFMLKMIVVGLAIVLSVISGFGWVISTPYAEAFKPAGMISARQTLHFSPYNDGYAVSGAPFNPEPVNGAPVVGGGRIDLPFAMTFYGQTYRTAFAGEAGLGFQGSPRFSDASLGYARQPAILSAVTADADGLRRNQVVYRAFADRLVVNWVGAYAHQLVLHKDQTIDLSYFEAPQASYRLFGPDAAPWFFGLTPGTGAKPHGFDVSALPARSDGSGPLIADYYLQFLHHLDRLYASLAIFTVVSAAFTALALPIFFRANLLEPLKQLLSGVDRFHAGQFDVQVPVAYNDEIGFLTRAFNAMASSLHDLVARLEERVAERVDEVGQFAAMNALLEERGRLAAELHDSVSQTLVSAALLADALPTQLRRDSAAGVDGAERIAQLNRHALEEIRLLTTDLHLQELANLPLAPMLDELGLAFAQTHGIEVERDVSGQALLPSEVQAMFYRIAQEALTNIARHASAQRVSLYFEALQGQALLRVVDDGRGFDIAAVGPGHLGLQIMSYRARLAGGSLEVTSSPGRGTTLSLVWFSNDEV